MRPLARTSFRYLGLDDAVIDLDLTPNRSDCLSMIGLARETGLMNSMDVRELEVSPVAPEIEDTFPVELASPEACPRFVGRVIRDIDQAATSPLWMKEKLRRAGLRSIDPVVDVTNYVMLELGQPLHAYDLDRLDSHIVVRQSVAGEKLTLLDESEVETLDNTLLITDASGPIGLAGVMGGLSTAVTAATKHVFLEGAFFATHGHCRSGAELRHEHRCRAPVRAGCRLAGSGPGHRAGDLTAAGDCRRAVQVRWLRRWMRPLCPRYTRCASEPPGFAACWASTLTTKKWTRSWIA